MCLLRVLVGVLVLASLQEEVGGLGDCFARLLPRSPEDSEQGLEGSSRLSEPCSLGRPHAEHLGTEFMAPLSF